MSLTIVNKPEFTIAGCSTRTTNAQEMRPGEGIILPTIEKFHLQAQSLSGRINPGVTICAYTDCQLPRPKGSDLVKAS